MPQSIPTGVFFRHFAIHTARNIATWLRLCLVITVWLGFLPYMIRQVWRLLFWFSDGGWPQKYLEIDSTGNSSAMQALEMARQLQLASLSSNGTSPVTPFNAAQTTSASVGGIVDKLIGFLMPFSHTLNISGADPLAAGLFKSLYYGLGLQSVVLPEGPVSNASVSQFIMGMSPTLRSPSLLSDINFLKNLTRHSTVNRLIISIAEGYIITILVVVSSILVFLIREWVVQQQPGINMGAGFNAEFPAAGDQPARAAWNGEARDLLPVIMEPGEVGQRPIAPPRRNNAQPDDAGNRRGVVFPQDEIRQDRPAPVRDALTPAAEIQRQLTEEPRMTEEFLAIWRRADSDPKEVLRIIEAENKGDQMRYWVNAMKILQHPRRETRDNEAGPSTLSSNLAPEPSGGDQSWASSDSNKAQTGSDQGSASGESWVDVSKPLDAQDLNSLPGSSKPSNEGKGTISRQDKGKGKVVEEPNEPLFDPYTQVLPGMNSQSATSKSTSFANDTTDISPHSLFTPKISRPRSTSDGPKLRESISPLANNNWSFGNLSTSTQNANVDNFLPNEMENNSPGDSEPKVFGGESAATFNAKFDFPPRPIGEEHDLQSWKAAQDLRVQQAIAKGREAHKSVLERTVPPVVDSSFSDSVLIDAPIEVKGLDGVVRTEATLDELFENNPVSSDSEDGVEDTENALEQSPFAPDVPLPATQEPVAPIPAEPQGLIENVADWLWGGAERQEEGANDEHIVQDLAAEAPFVPVVNRDGLEQGEEVPEQDQEVVNAAIAAGIDLNDPDAMDDAEDFEGVMELVGMRGPVSGLIQNALFSAFLLALTVAFGVWIPYNIGRAVLLLSANSLSTLKLVLRLVFSCAALVQDLVVSVLAVLSYSVFALLSIPMKIWYAAGLNDYNTTLAAKWGTTSLRLSHEAIDRIMNGTINGVLNFTNTDMFIFSAASHESLLTIKWLVTYSIEEIGRTVIFLFVGDYTVTLAGLGALFTEFFYACWNPITQFLAKPEPWVISLEVAKRTTPLDLELSVWDGIDRFWAVLAGYTALSLAGAMYVRKGSPFSNGQIGREWEATIIDLLNQAGGVMKVILIISIEMLVFPLYCGLLLDAALLPLFEDATIMSRILFTFKSPLTSIFVHWFVGTCYMFHFALFVSMCRKIMRKGVLYFIRDPDDPTFHPVRDVLERNVATQLRKILFSALVYGALVVICLGGVVWGLAFAFNGVLPIHWSSNEPVLEFPIDLLFYNFLMPLAVRFFKPSDGLHAMYNWWFQQCARMLRLTWFMFDDRQKGEEGHIVRRSWKDFFRGIDYDHLQVVRANDPTQPFDNPEVNAYIRQDGHYVRAPASDQVRIPKGTQIFLEVDEFNNRLDGKWDRPDGVHGRDTDLYKQVYIPPYFRLRICAFIISIWLFAALTGVSITIVPLVFGRQVFSKMIPSHVRKNDVYAFSIGIYILGSGLYLALHARYLLDYLATFFSLTPETPRNFFRHLKTASLRIAKVVWTYSAFVFLLPTLFAFLLEFYAILPLHTYFSPSEPHTIHFVQSWTLGLLYVKLTTRLIQFYPDSRPAVSLGQITRDGYLNPDARLATRSFILPATLVLSTALLWPWTIARLAVFTIFRESSEEEKILVYRYVYPAVLAAAGVGYMLYLFVLGVKRWRMRVRDEVYLIGERLHNFGEKKSGAGVGSGDVRSGMRRIETG